MVKENGHDDVDEQARKLLDGVVLGAEIQDNSKHETIVRDITFVSGMHFPLYLCRL